MRCWGRGDSGSLGQGSPEDRGDQPNELPVPDIELGGHTTMLGTGGGHTCVRLDNGRARCWGYGFDGALGYGTTTSLGGRVPVNPSGGLACFGEAVPAQAIAQVCELTWQLRGQATGRQVEGATVGITANQGLFGHGSSVILVK